MAWFKQIRLVAIGVLLASCTVTSDDYNIQGLNASPTVAVPLAYGDLSIADLLSKRDSAYVKVQPDGLVYLSYNQFLISQDIRNLFTIPDIGTITTPLAVPAGTYPPAPNDLTVATTNTLVDLNLNPEKLTEIGFKSGTLSYTIGLSQPNPKFNYAVLISIPEFVSKADGSVFSQEVSSTGTIPLSDYIFKSNVVNKFNLKLSLIIKKSAAAVTIAPGTVVNSKIAFAGMNFTYIKGFFGDQTVATKPQTLDIHAFGTSLSSGADVSFVQPSLNLTVINDYGVPLEVSFTKLEARKTGGTLAMQTNPASPIPVNQPLTLGTSANTVVSVTNVAALMNFVPTQFYFQVSGRINKGFVNGKNFMADTSKMWVGMQVSVPLYGKASNIVMADTIDADFGDLEESKIATASLKTTVSNELPLDANLQIYFADQNYKVLDSLLDSSQSNLVKGSLVNAAGDLQTASVSDKLIPLDGSKISKIFKGKKIIIKARMSTSKDATGSQVDVKFRSSYKIAIKIGLEATLKIVSKF